MEYNEFMKWQIEEHKQYTEWFEGQEEELQDEILAVVGLLQREGPKLSRPYADTWRILFAFDPRRFAILLLGGNKTGNARWYKETILIADKRFTEHLEKLQKDKENAKDDNTRRKNDSTESRKKGKNRGKNR
jgi:hypothetical protein